MSDFGIPNGLSSVKELMSILITIIFTSFLIIRFSNLTSLLIRVTIVDVLVVLYLIIIPSTQFFFTSKIEFIDIQNDFTAFIIFVVIRIYFSVIKSNLTPLYLASIIILFINILIAVSQYFGFTFSYHTIRGVSGMYLNPGPFSIILSVLFVLTLSYTYVQKSKANINYAVLILLLIVTTLILFILQSRTAITSIIISFSFFLAYTKKEKIVSLYKTKPFIFYFAIMVFVSFFTLFIHFLYNVRPDSVKGRVLIWNSTIIMIQDNFIFGGGINKFKAVYSKYQSLYLNQSQYNLDYYGQFADETHYAFNHFLQIFAERGFIGFSVFISIITVTIFTFFINKKRSICHSKKLEIGIFSVFILLISSSITSYSLDTLSINLFFWTIIAILNSSNFFYLKISTLKYGIRILSAIILLVIIYQSFLFTNKTLSYLHWKSYLENTDNKHHLFYAYNGIRNVADINRHIGDVYFTEAEYHKAIDYYKQALNLAYDTEYSYAIATCYERLGLYLEAEEQYLKTSKVVPKLLKPHYSIAKIRYKMGDIKTFQRKSLEVLNFTPKINSPEIIIMKHDIQKIYLELFDK